HLQPDALLRRPDDGAADRVGVQRRAHHGRVDLLLPAGHRRRAGRALPAQEPARRLTRMSRLAIVLSHPTQYYSPWFRWMAAHTPLDFRVFYLWEFGVTTQLDREFGASFKWDVDLLSGYDHEFVPNVARDPGTHHFGGLNTPALGDRLRAWHPDAVLL